jgi:hypothetical protein
VARVGLAVGAVAEDAGVDVVEAVGTARQPTSRRAKNIERIAAPP